MDNKKSRSKTLIAIIVLILVIIGAAFYYVAAVRNSDRQPHSVKVQS